MLRDYESVFDIKTSNITSCFVLFPDMIKKQWQKLPV